MLSSVYYDSDDFRSFGSNASSKAKNLWECFPEQMAIVCVVEQNSYIIESVNPLQKNRLGSDLISVGKHLNHLFPSTLGEELVINCARCVKEGMPVNYEVADGYIDGEAFQHSFQVLLFPIMNQPEIVTHLLCIILTPNKGNHIQIAKYSEQELERRVLERTAQLMATNLHLSYLATHDGLTGTYNRRHLIDLANAEFKRVSRYGLSLCLMMLDIDHFKLINDEQGHAAGDHMLKTLAHVMRSTVRDLDLVGRYGGDEFIIILPETDIQGAHVIAERLSSTLQDSGLSVSIGIATLELTDRSIEDLIIRADHLLLNAKRNGRNRIECAPLALSP